LNLSGGQRQIVAITRTTGFGSDYVILDEPTSALSPSAAREVLDVVRSLADSGIGVIIITHNVAQGLKVADKATVLRLGRVAGVTDAKSTSEEELVSMIVGTNLAA
jgi:D-xylose transport system ATP-binding protein